MRKEKMSICCVCGKETLDDCINKDGAVVCESCLCEEAEAMFEESIHVLHDAKNRFLKDRQEKNEGPRQEATLFIK